MQKNVTESSGAKRPDFLKIFLWVFTAYILAQAIFRPREIAIPPQGVDISSMKEAPRVPIPFGTASVEGNFNATGLRLDDLRLVRYHEGMSADSPNVGLLRHEKDEKESGERSSYVEFGLLGAEEESYLFPSRSTKWSVVSHTPSSVALKWTNPNGVEFARDMSFDDGYMLTVRQRVANRSKSEIGFYPYARAVQASDAAASRSAAHTGFVGYLGGKLEEHTYRDLMKKRLDFASENGWLGFGSDYFMTILVPQADGRAFTARAIELPRRDASSPVRQFQADYVGDGVFVPAGGEAEIVSRAYIGAKESDAIAKYESEFSIPKFDLVIDYGSFYILAKPFTQVLKFLYGFTGNFGWAIIIFTLLIRALLFPIAQKSFRSMEKMKKLQPEMKRIQTLYANDRQRMNMELAMLYKTSGVNPLSGCLPILLQLPVFIALYKALIISIEMRHAPFVLWIGDLSAPDTTSMFNLFGLLPYEPWSWLPHIGLLPLIMGATMYAQQAMQPAMGMDPIQAKAMKFLPLIFTLLLAGFPSGLVLYWTVSNVFSIVQQKYIR
ncbi:MAG: membrane protein insertase YidC [Rickettsiales bacterium]|jgi:YidC/Oxa1 family membrane protein insertase|nr:membrane protein insertase YidC [Rickettsiales bacterium]